LDIRNKIVDDEGPMCAAHASSRCQCQRAEMLLNLSGRRISIGRAGDEGVMGSEVCLHSAASAGERRYLDAESSVWNASGRINSFGEGYESQRGLAVYFINGQNAQALTPTKHENAHGEHKQVR
jgi:hypothetical protein